MGFWAKCRVDICRDRHNRRSPNFSWRRNVFRKQSKILSLSNLRFFCVISFTDGVNLCTYCENLCTYSLRFCTNVEINSKMWRKNKSFSLFNLISNHSLLLQISKCRALRGFWCNICLKNWGCVILFWQMSSLTICWTGCRVLPLRMLSTWVWPRLLPQMFPNRPLSPNWQRLLEDP